MKTSLVRRGDIGRRGRFATGAVLREEGLTEPIPGEPRHDGVDPGVETCHHQGDSTTVGAAGEADHRISAFFAISRRETAKSMILRASAPS